MVSFISTFWLKKIGKDMNKQKIKIGDNAPDFCLLDQNLEEICLSNFKEKNVIKK
ncbi:MAG: hypothetical protein JSU91_04990 [Thermoplasmatales archaeon]|nr:MAG: hypothetical protein JSU91_04990 [Thermoplasmatales archaeon]